MNISENKPIAWPTREKEQTPEHSKFPRWASLERLNAIWKEYPSRLHQFDSIMDNPMVTDALERLEDMPPEAIREKLRQDFKEFFAVPNQTPPQTLEELEGFVRTSELPPGENSVFNLHDYLSQPLMAIVGRLQFVAAGLKMSPEQEMMLKNRADRLATFLRAIELDESAKSAQESLAAK